MPGGPEPGAGRQVLEPFGQLVVAPLQLCRQLPQVEVCSTVFGLPFGQLRPRCTHPDAALVAPADGLPALQQGPIHHNALQFLLEPCSLFGEEGHAGGLELVVPLGGFQGCGGIRR